MAKQVSCPSKDLSKQIAKAKKRYAAKEDELQAVMPQLDAQAGGREAPHVRGAFVVFQRTQFADDVINTAPKGAASFASAETCPVCA